MRFNERNVEYLIVGGCALAYPGASRYTGGLDLLARPHSDNARRVIAALAAFGFQFPNLSEDDFTRPGRVVQLGTLPARIDLRTEISGVTWDEAAEGAEAGEFGSIPMRYLGRDHWIRNKRASGRLKEPKRALPATQSASGSASASGSKLPGALDTDTDSDTDTDADDVSCTGPLPNNSFFMRVPDG